MKQFLYLDKDIVGSIVAQAEKGLITEISNETEELKGNTSKNVGQVETNGKIGGNIWKLVKAEAALNIEGEIEKEKVNNFATKEMVVKTMHDAAFDIAYDYIKPIYVVDDEVYTHGDYIEVNRKFEFVDMQYLEGLFSKDGLIDFLKKSAKEEIETQIEQAKEGLNRQQLRSSGKMVKNKVNELKKESDKQYDDIHDIISVFKKMIPYERMLISSDGYLIPCDNTYFRVNPKSMGFMYGGEITCVGMITNIIRENSAESDDIFATLHYTVNEALKKILPTDKENISVIHPIAIYYGK